VDKKDIVLNRVLISQSKGYYNEILLNRYRTKMKLQV